MMRDIFPSVDERPDEPANRRIHWLDADTPRPSTVGLLNLGGGFLPSTSSSP